jgi:hypothetical protein
MNDSLQTCECGSDEFITKPNAYDVYKIVDGKASFVSQEFVDDEESLYCRNCGRENAPNRPRNS